MTEDDLFWRAEVDANSGCWLWRGALTGTGYPMVSIKGRVRGAHRIAMEIAHGPQPRHIHACHKCDTPACVNPRHMFPGTAMQNTADMYTKGRNHKWRRDDGEHSRAVRLGIAKSKLRKRFPDLTDTGIVRMAVKELAGKGNRK
jgi:hypothetical protein